MTKPREKTREELQAEIEDGKKKIRQFENREKMLRQKLSKEERRTRSHRLIVRGAVFESIVPEAKNMTDEEAAALLRLALTSEPAREYLKKRADGQRFVQMRSEQTKNPPPSIILHESGAFVTQTALGFDGEATRKMSAFLQGPKPELLHHQKFFENGTAERAKESGTEQNYNMIDGCVNNVPKKPRRIGGRWSVLDRLHIKQAERRQKDNAPQQEQERSRKS